MVLLVAAYLGGILTISSPCILPVLPFVLARVDRPFLRNGLPLLSGMAVTFAAVATLAAVGGGWAVQANQIGRWAAMLLMALFGASLLFPRLAEMLTRPAVALGQWLSSFARSRQERGVSELAASFLLGIGTGLLWAPCAGPILGLVLGAAALAGPSWTTAGLLLAYALGAATTLAVALLAGGRLVAVLKRRLRVSDWIRRGLGVAVLGGVALIALGLDTGLLTRISLPTTTAVE
ncbi:MAG TPA: cytochrome c biogenesis protein CcdA, partial [Limnochordia bacterium]